MVKNSYLICALLKKKRNLDFFRIFYTFMHNFIKKYKN